MKLNLIIPSFYPAVIYGGPIFSSLNASKELAKLYDIEVFVSTTNTNMYSKLDVKTNVDIEFEKDFYVKYYDETFVDKFSLALFLNVYKDIKRADVVHVQYIFNTPTPWALLLAKFYNKPVLLSTRGVFCKWCLAQGSRFKRLWLNLLIKPFAKKIYWHATAQQEKDEILAVFPDAKVTVIPNGIHSEEFKVFNVLSKNEYTEKFLGTMIEAKKIVVSMGRLQKKKGFDILVNSFVEVLKYEPNSLLLIAGDDEGEKGNLLSLIKKLELTSHVFLVGSIQAQDKIDFLANADLFALSSHNENFGNVYIEALASGTPIVASQGTPWSEVEEYECGKWVENSVVETSNAIVKILQMDRDIMRINSMKLATKYDWKYIAIQFKELYDKMIDEN
ncbi:MAG: glycosyltransferase [Helicobacteraceae bacterium]|nr:glycosyltransferase [Helicobacteraceae bacterium]